MLVWQGGRKLCGNRLSMFFWGLCQTFVDLLVWCQETRCPIRKAASSSLNPNGRAGGGKMAALGFDLLQRMTFEEVPYTRGC